MAEAGTCGSCVFTEEAGFPAATLRMCKIQNDPEVRQTYTERWTTFDYSKIDEKFYRRISASGDVGVCGKYQLNPASLVAFE